MGAVFQQKQVKYTASWDTRSNMFHLSAPLLCCEHTKRLNPYQVKGCFFLIKFIEEKQMFHLPTSHKVLAYTERWNPHEIKDWFFLIGKNHFFFFISYPAFLNKYLKRPTRYMIYASAETEAKSACGHNQKTIITNTCICEIVYR
jgi:hypothetical protein